MSQDFEGFAKSTEASQDLQAKVQSAFEALKQTLSAEQVILLLDLEELWQAESSERLLNAFTLTHPTA